MFTLIIYTIIIYYKGFKICESSEGIVLKWETYSAKLKINRTEIVTYSLRSAGNQKAFSKRGDFIW